MVTTYEKSGEISAGASLSGVATVAALASGGTSIAIGVKMIVHPPGPEPGFHLTHAHPDPLGLVSVGIGVGAIYATLRAVHWRDLL